MTASRSPITVTAVGECMIELRHTGPTSMELGYAGDTYNAAVYLKRAAAALGVDVRVGYLSGVGDDPYSGLMREAWRAEGIEDDSSTVAGASPGLYLVRTGDGGERCFHYWRSSSAAAELFATPDWIPALDADLVLLSGISLQIMPSAVRNILLAHVQRLRRSGSRIAFDTNYRVRGWPSAERARQAITTFAAAADFVLATFEDEQLLFGDVTPEVTLGRYLEKGNREVVVKVGAEGVHLAVEGDVVRVPAVRAKQVVDTTAAGDSFAGTYLAGRMAGLTPLASARRAVTVAAAVVGFPGAVADPADMAATYAELSRR